MNKMPSRIFIVLCVAFFVATACSRNKKLAHRAIANKNNIIQACFDLSGNYRQVTTIKSRTSYLEKAYDYQPVISENGFIAWDFTKDGRLDYIFIEKQQKPTLKKGQGSPKVRLVICKSRIDQNSIVRYQRVLPNFTLYESVHSDFQAESHKIRVEKNELILSRSYHEHNWGSDQTINSYQYNTQKSDFILVKQHLISSSGDGYRNDTLENYDFRDGQYLKTRHCGEFVGVCKTGQESGSFRGRTIKLSNSLDIFQSKVQIVDLY